LSSRILRPRKVAWYHARARVRHRHGRAERAGMQRFNGRRSPADSLLPALQANLHQASFARDMAAVAPADASALSTMPGHFQKSFCTHLGLMHGELSWRCRLHPSVRLVYSALYQNEDLVTGVDNVFFTQVLRCNPRHNITMLRHAARHTGRWSGGSVQFFLGARRPKQACSTQWQLGRVSRRGLRAAIAALSRFPGFIHHRAAAEITWRRVREAHGRLQPALEVSLLRSYTSR
jgi:hypothetical protein